jgi:RNA 3'-terminal phosphate cyclase
MDYLGRWWILNGATPATVDCSVCVNVRTAGSIGLIVRGIAEQTADLVKIQSTGGTDLITATAAGALKIVALGAAGEGATVKVHADGTLYAEL